MIFNVLTMPVLIPDWFYGAIMYLIPVSYTHLKDYAFNQVVYLKALQRAQKHLSVVNGQLVCDLKSGTETVSYTHLVSV